MGATRRSSDREKLKPRLENCGALSTADIRLLLPSPRREWSVWVGLGLPPGLQVRTSLHSPH